MVTMCLRCTSATRQEVTGWYGLVARVEGRCSPEVPTWQVMTQTPVQYRAGGGNARPELAGEDGLFEDRDAGLVLTVLGRRVERRQADRIAID